MGLHACLYVGLKPIIVKDEEFFHEQDCEQVISVAEAKRRGLTLRADASPIATAAYKTERSEKHDVYRESEFVPNRPATEVGQLTRAQKALAASHEAVRDLFLIAWNALGDLDARVAFAVDFDHDFQWSPTLGAIVDMIDSLRHDRTFRYGRSNWTLCQSEATDEELRSSLLAAQHCADALEATHSSFAFAYHIHGQEMILFRFGGRSRESAMRRLIDQVR